MVLMTIIKNNISERGREMKKKKDVLMFFFYFVFARLVRFLLVIFDRRGPLDMAMISNYRDQVDVRKFGFWSVKGLPDVLSWVRYVWEGKYKARLFMIGSLTEDIGGDDATPGTIKRASDQFMKAVETATGLGAKTILYAAATKRLPIWDELNKKYPGVVFTLGDNFTGLLLGEGILDAFKRTGLNPKNSRILIIGPYGLLGSVALTYALKSGAEVIGLGNPRRFGLLQKLQTKFGIGICTNFEEAGKVDMVVACNSAPRSQLTSERVELLRKTGCRLIVIDPNEPANMSPELFRDSVGKVIRLDSGNGFSSRLVHILEPVTPWLLRLYGGITWGCFAETFIISAHPTLRGIDWLGVFPKNIEIVRKFLGDGEGQFALPQPTCFNRPVESFELTLASEQAPEVSPKFRDIRRAQQEVAHV